MLRGEPRIATHAAGDGHGFLLRPVAMKPDEYKIVAERLEEVFREGRRKKPAPPPAVPVTDVSGRWDVEVSFALATSSQAMADVFQKLVLEKGGKGGCPLRVT